MDRGARDGAGRDADGHALVVRNGKSRTRKVTLGAGTIAVSAPRVNDRRVDDRAGRHPLPGRHPTGRTERQDETEGRVTVSRPGA